MIGEAGKIQSTKRTKTLIFDFIMERGIHMPRNVGEVENGHQLTANKETGTSELNSANNLNDQGNRASPGASGKEHSLPTP